MKRILILGASGFIGNALYKELNSYYDTFGTYFSKKGYSKNIKLNYDIQSNNNIQTR